MPANTVLRPLPGGVFGLPNQFFSGLPPTIRAKSTGTSTTLTLNSPPLPGSIILLGVGSVQATAASPSGAGASWSRIGRTFISSGSQIECDFWLGVVGSSPTGTITHSYVNSGGMIAVEIANGLNGTVLGSTTATATTGNAAITPVVASSASNPYRGRYAVAAVWYVSRTATVPSLSPGTWWYDTGHTSLNSYDRMMITPYRIGYSYSLAAGNVGNNQCVVAAIIG